MFLILGALRGFNTCTFTSLPASLSQSTDKLHSNDGTPQRPLERSSPTTSRPRSTRQSPWHPRHGWHWTKPVCIGGAQNFLFEPVSGGVALETCFKIDSSRIKQLMTPLLPRKKKAAAFGMTTQYYNRSPLSEELSGGAKYVNFDELLSTSDVLSLNLPLNVSTKPKRTTVKLAINYP